MQFVVLTDAVLVWFRHHPGYERVRLIFTELLGAIIAPLAPGVRVPEELLEVRNMLATRAEASMQQWLQEGEATLLLRQLERWFGALHDWARDRIAAADTAALEDWVRSDPSWRTAAAWKIWLESPRSRQPTNNVPPL